MFQQRHTEGLAPMVLRRVVVCSVGLTSLESDFARQELESILPEGSIVVAERIEDAISLPSSEEVVFFMRAPEVSLGLALAEDDDPAKALDKWVYDSEMLLKIFRNARKKKILLDIDLFFHPSDLGWSALCEKMGAQMKTTSLVRDIALRRPGSLFYVAARAIVQSETHIKAISQKLTAAMIGVQSDSAALETITEVLRGWTKACVRAGSLTEKGLWHKTGILRPHDSSSWVDNFDWVVDMLDSFKSETELRQLKYERLRTETERLSSSLALAREELQSLPNIARSNEILYKNQASEKARSSGYENTNIFETNEHLQILKPELTQSNLVSLSMIGDSAKSEEIALLRELLAIQSSLVTGLSQSLAESKYGMVELQGQLSGQLLENERK